MKWMCLIVPLLSSFLLTACDNELASENVPQPVKDGLAQHFPDVRVLEWEAIDETYVAEFNIDNIPYEAMMSREGEMLMYKYDILETELPEGVQNTLKAEYPDIPIANAEVLQYQGEAYYQIAFDGDARDYWLVFNKQGLKVEEPRYMK